MNEPPTTCNNIDELKRHNVDSKKIDKKKPHIIYYFTYLKLKNSQKESMVSG